VTLIKSLSIVWDSRPPRQAAPRHARPLAADADDTLISVNYNYNCNEITAVNWNFNWNDKTVTNMDALSIFPRVGKLEGPGKLPPPHLEVL